MVVIEEENFPRGGRKVTASLKRPIKVDDNLFRTEKPPKAKKAKKPKTNEKDTVTEDIFQSSLNIQGTLTYNKIQDGMVILGCIRHITNFSLELELPGLTFATVTVMNISDPLTKFLNKSLENNDEESNIVLKKLFQIGQFVPVRIISIKNDEDEGYKIGGSINPRDIYSERNHTSFKKGMLVWTSIESIGDHGYEINIGVKNCRVFLPLKNIDNGKTYSIGESLWCTVHKSEVSSIATTLRVSAKKEHIKATKLDEINNLDNIIPGTKVEFATDKITSHGIQGKFLENYICYVDKTHLKSPFQKLDDYNEGKLVTAHVLYIEPTTKITHLTLGSLDTPLAPTYKVGDNVSAEVFTNVFNGIFVKLANKEKGFITNKRLLNTLPKNANIEITEAIRKKYSPGSKHTCRILDYNYMTSVYICTVEQGLVKEKTFTIDDVKIGQVLNVVVDQIKPEGLIVRAGHLKGFVPNLHISNVLYTENIKKKYKEGSKVNARVLNIENGSIFLTLKPSLVESDDCLSDIKQAKPGQHYPGVVVSTKNNGALVVFYGNVKGWLGRKELSNEYNKPDPSKYFFRGQVVNVRILSVRPEKVMLTLLQESEKFKANIKIGQKVIGIVEAVNENDISIKSHNGKFRGIIPVTHLSVAPSLCNAIKHTFKPGDRIKNLICVDDHYPAIFSRKDDFLKRLKVKKFEELKVGNILRCIYDSGCGDGIYVRPLVSDHNENVLIPNKELIIKANGEIPALQENQSLLAKILSLDKKNKCLQLSLNVDSKKVETAIDYFSQYLADINYLRGFGSQNSWDICQYQPGERVSCKVAKLAGQGGCLVTLPNGINGLVPSHLCPNNLKEGQTIEGVVLSEEFEDNYVEVCLRNQVSKKINPIQDGKISTTSLSSCIVEKLVLKKHCLIGVLKGEKCNRQLVYIPRYLHENDFDGSIFDYKQSKFKVSICGKMSKTLIGISKKIFLKLDKERSRINKQKKARSKKIFNNDDANKTCDNGEEMEVNEDSSSEKEEIKAMNQSVELDANIDNMEEENENSDTEENDYESLEENEDFEAELEEGSDAEENSNDILEENGDFDEGEGSIEEEHSDTEENTRDHVLEENDESSEDESNNKVVGTLSSAVLPGVSSFFNPQKHKIEDGSSSDEDEKEQVVKKKKKLSASERGELLRKEEERISRIEKELADSNKTPENAEQFDRLLLANPNSSELWTKYISFHIAATEIDKARTVAKRALETINMTQIEDKFNIWVVFLNLENMFGTKESFETVFEDAVRYNDALQIYLRAIEMLAETGKYNEMEEKIRKVRGKHKQNPTMWIELAKVHYQIGKFKEARNLKEAALKSITDKKTQFNLIIRFAIMEFKYGEEEQGSAVFETVLSSDPRKVPVWTTYVDQLIKKGKTDQARKVLERSVCQKLPLKSMKALFLKFRKFEEEHGTKESLEAVKKRAQEYVSKVVK